MLAETAQGRVETEAAIVYFRSSLLFVNISPRQKVALLIPCALLWRHKVILHGHWQPSQSFFEKGIIDLCLGLPSVFTTWQIRYREVL